MVNKLYFLIKVSLFRKIKTKWFMIANMILLLLIVSLANIDQIITFFGGDFDKQQEVYLVDDTDQANAIFVEQIKILESSFLGEDKNNFEFIFVEEELDYEALIEEDNKRVVIIIKSSAENYLEATIITEVFLEPIKHQLITNALQNTKVAMAMVESEFDFDEYAKISQPIVIERIILDESKDKEKEMSEAIMATVFPIVILPFFMLTIFLVQMIGAEVNDEKSTRGMEIIISSVSPKIHFFAKVIAGNLFVIIQGGLLFLFGLIALFSRKIFGSSGITDGVSTEINNMLKQVLDSSLGDQLIYIIPLTLILMLLTFLAYALLAGILASMTTNIEDFQQLQTPIIIISLVGYYLSIMAGMFTGATFIKVFSFIPLISAILSPSLLVLEQIGITEVIISILLMIGFNFLLIKYGLRVYKVGILNYSTTDLWKKMFKALKNQ